MLMLSELLLLAQSLRVTRAIRLLSLRLIAQLLHGAHMLLLPLLRLRLDAVHLTNQLLVQLMNAIADAIHALNLLVHLLNPVTHPILVLTANLRVCRHRHGHDHARCNRDQFPSCTSRHAHLRVRAPERDTGCPLLGSPTFVPTTRSAIEYANVTHASVLRSCPGLLAPSDAQLRPEPGQCDPAGSSRLSCSKAVRVLLHAAAGTPRARLDLEVPSYSIHATLTTDGHMLPRRVPTSILLLPVLLAACASERATEPAPAPVVTASWHATHVHGLPLPDVLYLFDPDTLYGEPVSVHLIADSARLMIQPTGVYEHRVWVSHWVGAVGGPPLVRTAGFQHGDHGAWERTGAALSFESNYLQNHRMTGLIGADGVLRMQHGFSHGDPPAEVRYAR
jgi:hypothetical protein